MLQDSSQEYRDGHLAARAGHTIRQSLTQLTGMVLNFVTHTFQDRGHPATAATFRSVVQAAKSCVQHDSERKAERMFILHFLSWCVQMCNTPVESNDTVQRRMASRADRVPEEAPIYNVIKKIGQDLLVHANCRNARKFTEHVRASLRDLRTGEETREV